MTNSEKLQKLIEKAIEGGWESGHWTTSLWLPGDYSKNIAESTLGMHHVNELIFNHDFAKALVGDTPVELYFDDGGIKHQFMGGSLSYPYDEGGSVQFVCPKWEFHLQQAVISDDPISYMYEVVFKDQLADPSNYPEGTEII